MALRASIVLTPLFFENHDGSSPALVDDLRRDLCAFDQRLSDEEAFVAMNQPYVAQFHHSSDVAWKTFNLNVETRVRPDTACRQFPLLRT